MKLPAHLTLAGDAELRCSEDKKKRQFKQLAHAGSRLTGFFSDIVYELSGMKVPSELPILQQHDHKLIVGMATQNSVDKDGVNLAGDFFNTQAAREVQDLADQGFKWQASIGVRTLEAEFVDEDEERVVNGRKECGPFVLVSKSEVYESSFVPIGADRNTRSVVLSDAGGAEVVVVSKKEKTMSEKTTAPAASAVDAVAEERKRVTSLKLAFPNDPSFALKHIELGSSVLEAKAAYADELQKKITELQNQPQQLPSIPSRGGSSTAPTRSPTEEWNERLTQELAAYQGRVTGDVRFAAIRRLSLQFPKLHQAYLEEYNATRPVRARA